MGCMTSEFTIRRLDPRYVDVTWRDGTLVEARCDWRRMLADQGCDLDNPAQVSPIMRARIERLYGELALPPSLQPVEVPR